MFLLPQEVDTPHAVLFAPDVFFGVSMVVMLTIGFGSLLRIQSLRGGGASVALSIGGSLINSDTRNQKEKQLLNIVEEMSIASGVPIPLVFVLREEAGINAFAAGYSMNDAAIAVTKGALEQFSRDQLQGVIAHEFSHILNGDMRLNIRLIGVLAGILMLGNLGTWLMRISRTRRRSNDSMPLILVGVVLTIIGFVGLFFGQLIKAAVSRQREFLADASAVQFTRNPDGLAGALKKIGNFGSDISAQQAGDMSHMFFSNAFTGSFLSKLSATHPPLETRIERIDRDFKAEQAQNKHKIETQNPAGSQLAGFAGKTNSTKTNTPKIEAKIEAKNVISQIGFIQEEHIIYSRHMLAELPKTLREATKSLMPAVGLIYALLFNQNDDAIRIKQAKTLGESSHKAILAEAKRYYDYVKELNPSARISLVELTIPTLRQLSPSQFAQFKRELQMLIEADNKISVFEFSLETVLLHRLRDHSGLGGRGHVKHNNIKTILYQIQLLFSILARVGQNDPQLSKIAYQIGASKFPNIVSSAPILDVEHCRLDNLNKALEELAQVTPSIKLQLVDAAAHIILQDGKITVTEADLLRALTAALDCPLPLFLR